MARRKWLILATFVAASTCCFLIGRWSTSCYNVDHYCHRHKLHHSPDNSPAVIRNYPSSYSEPSNANQLLTIFAITPTYHRYTQKVDLTSLCHTLMHVPNLHWIVVEDSPHPTELVGNLLDYCNVTSTQLFVKRSTVVKLLLRNNWKGIEQRNFALNWLRTQCNSKQGFRGVLNFHDCHGVVYYTDDDNKYDLRLFDLIRSTKHVSIWPVAFSGALRHEGPICSEQGSITGWRSAYGMGRAFPTDMAGFAVNLQLIFRSRANFTMGQFGYMESDFIASLGVAKESIKCHKMIEALVWHVRTGTPDLSSEANLPSDPNFIT